MTAFRTTTLVPTGKTQNKIYNLILEGLSQAEIARRMRLKRATVSKHVKKLVDGKFLEIDKGSGKIKTIGNGIERGSKANTLDCYISAKKGENDATGVSPVSKKRASVKTLHVHHLQYLPKVLKEGDFQFITKQSKIHNNTQDLSGIIECPSGKVKFHIHRSYEDVQTLKGIEKREKQSAFYIYPPEIFLTPEEARDFEEVGRKICVEAIDIMTLKMGWIFQNELPINPNWKPHFAIEDPHAQGVSDKFSLYSTDGKGWLSNSEGALEFEFSDINHALTFLDMPKAVEDLSSRQSETEFRVGELEVSLLETRDEIGTYQDEVDHKIKTISEELGNTREDMLSLVEITRMLCESSSNITKTLSDHTNTIQSFCSSNGQISNESPKNTNSGNLGGIYL